MSMAWLGAHRANRSKFANCSAPVCDRFIEKFDTLDLKEAGAPGKDRQWRNALLATAGATSCLALRPATIPSPSLGGATLASRPREQMNLADIVPDGDVLIALKPEELGLRILQVLATWSPHIRQIRLGLFLSDALNGYSSYSRCDQIGQAIKEAWAWLEGQGLLLQDPRYMLGDMLVLSRKARRLAKESRMRVVH